MPAQQTTGIQRAFDAEVAAYRDRIDGTFGIVVRDLTTGLELGYNAEEVFPTASTMKTPLLYALYRLAQEGEIDLATRVPLQRHERVPGSGVLQHMDEGLTPTVRDLAELMIIVSDNYATDLLYRLVGGERLARILGDLGLAQTHLPHTTWHILAHMGGIDGNDPDLTYDTLRERLKRNRSNGDAVDPYTTDEYDRSSPGDMVRLMTLIEEGHGLSTESRAAMLDTLKHQNFNQLIPGRLPDDAGIEVAHKTGSVTGVRNDAGIVYAPGITYAIAIMSKGLDDPAEAVSQFAHLSRWVWDHLKAHHDAD